jgi:hypothetical protein
MQKHQPQINLAQYKQFGTQVCRIKVVLNTHNKPRRKKEAL